MLDCLPRMVVLFEADGFAVTTVIGKLYDWWSLLYW
jgi:hypothetical protein